jgi:hypothetical protein
LVTVTLTDPAAWEVVVPVMVVALIVPIVRADPPKETMAPAWNALPEIVTAVPPAVAPLVGATLVTAGVGARYVKQVEHEPLWVSAFVTVTVTDPAAWAVVVPVIVVALIVATVRADPPNETVAPKANPVPATVTDVPPAIAPVFGVTEVTVGAGATYVKQPEQVALCPSGFATTTFTDPAAREVVVPVIAVGLVVATVNAAPPNATVAPVWKPLPAIVTDVPPAVGPLVGVIDATVGAAT